MLDNIKSQKKIFVFIILLLIIILIPSCAKGEKFYNIDTQEEYFNLFYEQINNTKEHYVAYDLRTKAEYETEHIRQFQNYDISTKSLSDFLMYLKTNYGKKYHIYIYSPNEFVYQEIMRINKEYEEIHILYGSYQDLNQELLKELFTLDKGPYDCGC